MARQRQCLADVRRKRNQITYERRLDNRLAAIGDAIAIKPEWVDLEAVAIFQQLPITLANLR
jgi:hypothetical protein